MDNRKLPVGVQSFDDIRRNNYIYVDKTAYVWKLIQLGKSFFLSRPRRFGKSLFVSTLEAYFRGESKLFQGLDLEKYENAKAENKWIIYPVLKFSLSGGEYNSENGLSIVITWLH